jgi:hypothetical protein
MAAEIAETEYKVITADSAYDIAAEVNEHLCNGWKLCGGISVSKTAVMGVKATYAQAMTRAVFSFDKKD